MLLGQEQLALPTQTEEGTDGIGTPVIFGL